MFERASSHFWPVFLYPERVQALYALLLANGELLERTLAFVFGELRLVAEWYAYVVCFKLCSNKSIPRNIQINDQTEY